MKHAMILKYDVYVSLDYGLCNWKWKYMRIWSIRIHHITSFERRLSGCYVGETVNGVVFFIRCTLTVEENYHYSILNCRIELLKVSSNPLLVNAAALR